MASPISVIVQQLLRGMRTIAKTETLIGEPIEAGGATLVPIHRLKVTFGAAAVQGRGQASERTGRTEGGGAGGAVQIDPMAVIAVGADGTPRILSVDADATDVTERLLEQVPDLLVRVAKVLGERAKDSSLASALTREGIAFVQGMDTHKESRAEKELVPGKDEGGAG